LLTLSSCTSRSANVTEDAKGTNVPNIMAAIVAHSPTAPWKLTQRLQEVESVEEDPEAEPEEEEMGHVYLPQICDEDMGNIHLPQTCETEMGDIHVPQSCEEEMGDVHMPQTCNLQPSAADKFPRLPPALHSSPSYCPLQQQPSQPDLQPRPQHHPPLPDKQHHGLGQEQMKQDFSFVSSSAEELQGRRSLQQPIEYYDRAGPAVPVDSTLGGFSLPVTSAPDDSEMPGLPPLPAPVLPPPPPPPESPPSQRTTLDVEAAPDVVSFAVNQAKVGDIATATSVGSKQQLLLELDPKADVADNSVADDRGQEASSQQFFAPVLPAPAREAPSWQATQRRHSIAAPTASRTMGGADFNHHGFSVGPGNLQRSQSIFDLPEPGLALFGQNGSLPTPVGRVLQPPRGLDLENISAGLLPPRGLLNPFMGHATPQARGWPGMDYSSMRHVTPMATPGCALQGSMTPPAYIGSVSMAQRSSVEYRRMAVQ